MISNTILSVMLLKRLVSFLGTHQCIIHSKEIMVDRHLVDLSLYNFFMHHIYYLLTKRLKHVITLLLGLRLSVCFVVVLHNSNSISVISWQWHDVWDKEKARTYIFNDWRDLLIPIPYRYGMRGIGLWWCCKLQTARTWIAAHLKCIGSDWIHNHLTKVTNPVS